MPYRTATHRMAAHRMAHFAGKAHVDKATLGRVNSAIMLGLIGSGLVACAVGAIVYDFGRWFSAW
jgi:hypothetical protein